MATYTAAGRSIHKTLTANTVDTVTLDNNYGSVEVKNHGTTASLYFLVDSAATPAIAADGTYVIDAGEALVVDSTADEQTGGATVVKLISASAIAYSVTGASR